jgi:hypothetical protein
MSLLQIAKLLLPPASWRYQLVHTFLLSKLLFSDALPVRQNNRIAKFRQKNIFYIARLHWVTLMNSSD